MVGAAAGVGIGYLAGYEGTDLIAWGVGGAVIGGVIGAVTGTLISYTATGSLTSSFSQIKAGFAAAKLNPGQCFVAGTLVLTEDGLIPIEEVEEGMLVWASDPGTGETALKPVVQLFRNETTELVHVTVNGEEIVCTNEHPFYSPVKGWTEACQLRAGDILVLVNGEYVIVEQVQHEILEAPVATYNFEVQDFHTYYVGKSAVLVHNLCTVDADDFTKISTGRATPNNLIEKLAMESAKSNPSAGKILNIRLKDSRLPKGAVKMSQVFDTSIGKIDIHYVWDKARNIFFDFKFK